MAIILLALGSRGDVQPMATLAGELVRRGCEARLVATHDFQSLAAALGAPFVAIDADSADAVAMTHHPLAEQVFGSLLGQAALLRRWSGQIASAVARAALDTVRPGDTVVSGILTRELATSLAEGLGARAVTVAYTGQLPTAYRESHLTPQLFRSSPAYNRAGSRLGWRVATSLGMPAGRIARAELGLPRRGTRRATTAADMFPTLIAASPLVVPPAPDWPVTAHQTGYLVGPSVEYHPPPDLVDFLAGGEPVVYAASGAWARAALTTTSVWSSTPRGGVDIA